MITTALYAQLTFAGYKQMAIEVCSMVNASANVLGDAAIQTAIQDSALGFANQLQALEDIVGGTASFDPIDGETYLTVPDVGDLPLIINTHIFFALQMVQALQAEFPSFVTLTVTFGESDEEQLDVIAQYNEAYDGAVTQLALMRTAVDDLLLLLAKPLKMDRTIPAPEP